MTALDNRRDAAVKHLRRCRKHRPQPSLSTNTQALALSALPPGIRQKLVQHPKGLMRFSINTHDAWGTVKVGDFQTLEEARQAFADLCLDPWYSQDGGVKGLELIEQSDGGAAQRLDWFAFR